MRFPPSFLDEIRARLPVSDVVRRRVKLVKAGREWKGLSPFGSEKTPSFFVNDQKMAWFDFSSGKNGNVFDFLMETEGLTFPETVERLAQEAGLALPARSEESERFEKKRAGLHEVLEWAAAFFEAELKSGRGAKARAYLDGRAVSSKSRADFRIGYSPADRHALRDALASKGASLETMCEAGLLIHGPDVPVAYDRFRDRVMFPITDRGGRVIAFGGRALEKDVQAKYLNSPETPLFHKGNVLFNHHRARKAAHESGRVIVVEGYLDVVAMHAGGFPETVATLGTAITEEHAALLWKMAPQPILCFDGDKAGRKAAFRAADLALPIIGPERTLAFALLPGGQDPDDLIRTAGAGAMRDVLAAADPLVDIVWGRETETRVLTTPEQRAALEHDLAAIAGTVRDESLRRHYKAEFDRRLVALFGPAEHARAQRSGRDRGRRGAGRMDWRAVERIGYLSSPVLASPSLTQSAAFRPTTAAYPPREVMIVAILLSQPQLVEEFAEDLAEAHFAARDLANVRDCLLGAAHEGVATGAEQRALLADIGLAHVLAKLDRVTAAASWYLRPEAASEDAAAVLGQALILHRKTRALHTELLSAETALATDASEANLARLRDIQEQLGALVGMEAAVEGFGALSGRTSTSL